MTVNNVVMTVKGANSATATAAGIKNAQTATLGVINVQISASTTVAGSFAAAIWSSAAGATVLVRGASVLGATGPGTTSTDISMTVAGAIDLGNDVVLLDASSSTALPFASAGFVCGTHGICMDQNFGFATCTRLFQRCNSLVSAIGIAQSGDVIGTNSGTLSLVQANLPLILPAGVGIVGLQLRDNAIVSVTGLSSPVDVFRLSTGSYLQNFLLQINGFAATAAAGIYRAVSLVGSQAATPDRLFNVEIQMDASLATSHPLTTVGVENSSPTSPTNTAWQSLDTCMIVMTAGGFSGSVAHGIYNNQTSSVLRVANTDVFATATVGGAVAYGATTYRSGAIIAISGASTLSGSTLDIFPGTKCSIQLTPGVYLAHGTYGAIAPAISNGYTAGGGMVVVDQTFGCDALCTFQLGRCATVTKGSSLATVAGNAVYVFPGTYTLATGETFPIVVTPGVGIFAVVDTGMVTLSNTPASGSALLSIFSISTGTVIQGFTFVLTIPATTTAGTYGVIQVTSNNGPATSMILDNAMTLSDSSTTTTGVLVYGVYFAGTTGGTVPLTNWYSVDNLQVTITSSGTANLVLGGVASTTTLAAPGVNMRWVSIATAAASAGTGTTAVYGLVEVVTGATMTLAYGIMNLATAAATSVAELNMVKAGDIALNNVQLTTFTSVGNLAWTVLSPNIQTLRYFVGTTPTNGQYMVPGAAAATTATEANTYQALGSTMVCFDLVVSTSATATGTAAVTLFLGNPGVATAMTATVAATTLIGTDTSHLLLFTQTNLLSMHVVTTGTPPITLSVTLRCGV